MRKKKNRYCIAGLALFAVCLTACGTTEAMQKEIELLAPVDAVVDMETVMYRDLYTMTTKDAELAPYTEELTFEASGTVSKLYVKLGSVVKKGELLAELEEEGVRSKASSALDQYLREKKNYVDTVKAVNKKLAGKLSAEEREWQELILAQAEELWQMQEPVLWNAWEEAREKLGKNTITAPFDGVVTACIGQNATVAAGQPAIALADTERVCITMGSYLPLSEIQNQERVYGIVNGKETELIYLDDLMEEESTYTYFGADDFNGAQIGDFVLICMVGNYHENVLSIPENAVYRDSNGTYVYLVEDGIRTKRDVILGYDDNVYVEIVEGLKEGDRVYVKN
ncbi:MAG: efflux RND transporter periplasmic adaptor subunit [Lachnospiraceae bacterium]|nr:efflux RND transporter periplasmic adaptor subunit [Lachnospiraceae bacterium]